uniref:F-actin binding domain-containing protein n=1 Tax=Ditylenchus dipsaci TaxID=166011 RepID=A0A915DZ27_9BILA
MSGSSSPISSAAATCGNVMLRPSGCKRTGQQDLGVKKIPGGEQVGLARVRQLVTQKVEPLQHHRPFSMQSVDSLQAYPNPTTNSSKASTSHLQECNSQMTTSTILQTPKWSPNHKGTVRVSGFTPTVLDSFSQQPCNSSSSNRTLLHHPFATLQRSSTTSVKRGAAESPSKTLPQTSAVAPFIKPRSATKPSEPVNRLQEEESEELLNGRISRAQSLRDLASKFERVHIPKEEVNQAVGRLPDKRYSLMESGSGDLQQQPHHSTPPTREDSMVPTVSKEYLVELHRKLEGCMQDLRNEKAPRRIGAVLMPSNKEGNHHDLLIKLSDVCQQFHQTCTIYAENITPHSKFRFRELLNRMEQQSVRQLRSSAAGMAADTSTSPTIPMARVLWVEGERL